MGRDWKALDAVDELSPKAVAYRADVTDRHRHDHQLNRPNKDAPQRLKEGSHMADNGSILVTGAAGQLGRSGEL